MRRPTETYEASPDSAEQLYGRIRDLQPRIAALAPAMQKARRLDDQLVADLDATGAFQVFVSRRWGGLGLSVREASEVLRLLAQVDFSVSWNASIYLATTMFIQRFPEEVQKKVFADGPSLRSPGVIAPAGTATRTAGGVRLSGRWPYASGVQHSNFVMVASKLDTVPHWFLMPVAQATVLDDWDMAGIAASGSATVVLDDVFIPDGWYVPMLAVNAATGHGGNTLPEPIHSYPLTYMGIMNSAMPLGALQSAVAGSLENLRKSKPAGIARIDRPELRLSWAQAAETLRMLELSFEDMLAKSIDQHKSGREETLEEQGRRWMTMVTILHMAKDTLRSLLDNTGGSSLYRNSELLQRQVSDVGAMSTHLLLGDYYVLAERSARWMLGFGRNATDPQG